MCTVRDLKTELQLSEKIFVGQLIDLNRSRQEIKILKVWKGEIKTQTLAIATKPKDGCHRRILYPTNEYFVVFLEGDGIHNCSRTMLYLESTDIKFLDSVFSKTLWVQETEKETLARLEYTRQYIIHTDKGEVDIKGKKVIFNFEGSVKPRENLPLNGNDFYPVRYFLVATKESMKNNPCGIDYIFYVNQVHQDMILGEKRRQKVERKSLRSACRSKEHHGHG